MTDDQRIMKATTTARASMASADAARARLEAVLDASDDGVPVKPMEADDSMAIELDDERRTAQEAITRTERSRRAVTSGGGR